MLTNAPCCNAFLCKQHCFIFRHSTDKFICKGIQLYKLQNVRILRCIVQLLGSVQQVLQFVRIADQKDLRPWRLLQKVVILLCARILCQPCTLAATGVTDGPWAGDCILQQIVQPVLQLLVVGGCIDRDTHLAEECCIVDALMGLAVCENKTCTVDGKDHILLQQIDVMDDLVIGAL